MPNSLYYGDNLTVLRDHVADESVDLIYLDPPFNSSRNYNLLFKQVKGDASPAQIMAFEDTWTWSPLLYEDFKADVRNARLFILVAALYDVLGPSEMMAYVLMMAPRLLELHRKLKPTGSLYLHCDPVASHYLKIVLDVVFGPANFRSEVVWKRNTAHSGAKRWGPLHDVLLFYARSQDYTWNPVCLPHSSEYLSSKYRYHDDGGIYRIDNLTGAGTRTGDSGKPWRGFDPTALGRHWAVPVSTVIGLVGADSASVMSTQEKLDVLFNAGFVYLGMSGRGGGPAFPQFKRYLSAGIPIQDVVTDIDPINSQAKERRGYPTQKPLALLERIVAASSNEGDIVLDPFCGCGTAIVAAERMNRQWIGIDITYLAISEVIYRLNTEGAANRPLVYELKGAPVDALGAQKLFEQTAPQNHKPFEQFCVLLVAGESREKKGADRGIDGVIHLWDGQGRLRKAVISVKGGAYTLSHVRDFASVIKDNDAMMGLMITQTPATKEMQLVCEQQGYADWPSEKKYPRMQMRTVKDLLENPKRPFDIPPRLQRPQGVGRAQPGQETLGI